ncbi:restriction endonuclease [Curtobacterium sp. 1P10AnD]|uniref:restriction endonuclease n=1 Tax=Curtobacterium sp. 1P10AnD TaxID=3132283 RepID=UPI0039A1B027
MNHSNFDWRQAFRDAEALPDDASRAQKADRGRKFEKILRAMFADAGLEPRLSYRPKGEEIDGAIWFEGRTILIEAKWTQGFHPASSIYQFKGKVDGKLSGTLGLFISMSGFSPDAVDALVAGKELNLILADGDDIRTLANTTMTVSEALRRKLREAGEYGNPSFPLSSIVQDSRALPGRQIVITEGQADVLYLQSVQTLLGTSVAPRIVSAGGPSAMPSLVRSLLTMGDTPSIILVIDQDLESTPLHEALRSLQTQAESRGTAIELIWVAPDLEVALGLSRPDVPWEARKSLRQSSPDEVIERLRTTDVRNLAKSNDSLRQLLRALGINTAA